MLQKWENTYFESIILRSFFFKVITIFIIFSLFHIEREKYRQRLIYNSILKYSTPFIPPTFSNTYQVSVKLDSIAICHNNFTKASWFLLDRRDLLAGSYFKFAGDLQESSSRGKSWGMAFACFPIDRRDRYRKSWRCETERPTTLDPRQCKILFFPYPFFSPPLLFLLFSLPSFSLFLFRVFVSQIDR